VYWLDWGAEQSGINSAVLHAWMRHVMLRLPRLVEGLRSVRVIATLGVVPSQRERFREVASQWLGELAQHRPPPPASITSFALGLVTVAHVRSYLEGRRCCPLELVHPVAVEIHRLTGGVFAKVIVLVEELEHGGRWRAFASNRVEPEPIVPVDPNETL
jgi:hypothetical protein